MNLSLDDYFKASFQEKLLIKMPERENDQLTVATRLLDKRREMNEVDQALNGQKEEYHMKMESLTQRREDLEKKEYQLRESLIKFDKFLKENDAKKVRAVKKAIEERTIKKQKMEEIEKLNADIKQGNELKHHLMQKLEKYQIFQNYLENVTEASEDLTEIREIIDRYVTLTCNITDLDVKNKNDYNYIEQNKVQLTDKRKKKDEDAIACNIKLTEKRQQLDNIRSVVIHLDDEVTTFKQNLAKKTLEMGRMLISIRNTYRLIRKYDSRLTQPVGLMDTDGQLAEIMNYLINLGRIKEIADKLK